MDDDEEAGDAGVGEDLDVGARAVAPVRGAGGGERE